MKKFFIRFTALFIFLCVITLLFISCGDNKNTPIIIFSSLSENDEANVKENVLNEFPDINLSIVHSDDLEEISIPEDKYCILLGYEEYDDLALDSFSLGRKSFVLAANTDVLFENGLEEPKKLSDLQKACYSGLIALPNPETTDCGYSFLLCLANMMGESEATSYFSSLIDSSAIILEDENESLEALLSMNAGIGLCHYEDLSMEIESGKPLSILSAGMGAIYTEKRVIHISKGSDNKNAPDVFGYLKTILENSMGDSKKYDINFYADMKDLINKEKRDRLLNEIKSIKSKE